jgi:hypothetical protein
MHGAALEKGALAQAQQGLAPQAGARKGGQAMMILMDMDVTRALLRPLTPVAILSSSSIR